MKSKGNGASIIDWSDVSEEVWESHLAQAAEYARIGSFWSDRYRQKSVGLIFMNPSLRTRCSMELAAAQLGAHVTTLEAGHGMWSLAFDDKVVMDGAEAEHVREAAGVLSRFFNALGIRVFATMKDYEADKADRMIRAFADASEVPVVNMESAWAHPCQALADAATLHNHFHGETVGRKFVLSWAYHPKALPMAVPNSTVLMAARMGMEVVVARPETHALDRDLMGLAVRTAASSGGSVVETDEQSEAFEAADIVYTKAWGGPLAYSDPDAESAARTESKEWRVSEKLMQLTSEAPFMHCLPVRRNVVVDDAVLDGPRSLHLTQAENRLHAQKAIFEHCWATTPQAFV